MTARIKEVRVRTSGLAPADATGGQGRGEGAPRRQERALPGNAGCLVLIGTRPGGRTAGHVRASPAPAPGGGGAALEGCAAPGEVGGAGTLHPVAVQSDALSTSAAKTAYPAQRLEASAAEAPPIAPYSVNGCPTVQEAPSTARAVERIREHWPEIAKQME